MKAKPLMPQVGDFVKIYGYIDFEKGKFEIGRVTKTSTGQLCARGIAQNNESWKYTEFEISLERNGRPLFEFTPLKYASSIVQCKVWEAVWKPKSSI